MLSGDTVLGQWRLAPTAFFLGDGLPSSRGFDFKVTFFGACFFCLLTPLLQQLGDEPGPASLVTRPDSAPVIAVEVLVKEDEVTPVRIVLESRVATVDRATAIGVS